MKSIKITANASFLFGNVQSNSGHWECQNFCVSFLQIREGGADIFLNWGRKLGEHCLQGHESSHRIGS